MKKKSSRDRRYTIKYIRYTRGSMDIRKRLKEKNNISIKDGMEARQNIQNWKKSIVIPLYKREEKEEVKNYREISLLCTVYKIYAKILRNRLEREVEEKEIIPETNRL